MDSTASVSPLEPYPLRQVWPHEALNFTPWMAKPEALAQLGRALGLGPLEYISHEQSVGDFSADVVARDPWGRVVVIENQLEPTDHKHLGQAIVYVAGVEKAGTVVWVASRIRPEHAAALRWLNGLTPASISFFGVEVATWTISGSSPGYQFNVVVRPDTQTLARDGDKPAGPLTEQQIAARAYWSAFRDFLDERGAEHWIRPDLPRGEWWGRNLGRPGFNIYAVVKPKSRSLSVMLEISSPDHATVHAALAAEREAIHRELGTEASWSSTEARDYVTTERKDLDPNDRTTWPEQHAWLLDQMERYRQVFRDRVAAFGHAENDGPSPEPEKQDGNS